MRIANRSLRSAGQWLARYLSREVHVHGLVPETSSSVLLSSLQPGDVLLVEGHSRFSTAIKYLTQSTWSHAALYVGGLPCAGGDPCFIEADIVEGVRSVGVQEYAGHATRICRPVGLDDAQVRALVAYAVGRVGAGYDLRNIIDLVRYLLPTPPVALGMRRRLLALGSGDPTRAICSTLVAQAFESIRYPILPLRSHRDADTPECPGCREEILHIRHHSLYVPRDFDISPYFKIVKPELGPGFDPLRLAWSDDQAVAG